MTINVVEISGLSFSWPGSASPAIELDRLEVAQKERLFVQGPSGSGKSTLLGLLAGVITPGEGEVTVLGQSMSKLSAAERDHFRANHLGYIFQQFNLIPYLSVIENVTLPLRFSKERSKGISDPKDEAKRLLHHLGMASDDLIDRSVTELSVGQQQRVAAARALIGAPGLVIADEPTSALDAANRESFIDLLFQECEKEGSALVFVSHDAGLASMFDRTIELGGAA